MGSDFLFAQPSWLSGVARTLDIGGQFDDYNVSRNGDVADAKASFLDWRTVGEHLVEAIKTFRRDTQAPTERASQ